MIPSATIPDNLLDILTVELSGTVADLTSLPDMASHKLLGASWSTPDGEMPILIRFYHSARCDEESRTEAAALRELYRQGFPVPELYLASYDGKMCGAPFIVLQQLEGRTLTDLAMEEPESIPKWIELATALLLKLHGLSWREGFDLFQPALQPLDYAERQVKWWSREAKKVKSPEAEHGFAWLRANLYRARDAERLSLVHRNYHPNTILGNKGRITGVIDWGELTIADPAVDVAWASMTLATEVSPALGQTLINTYQQRNPNIHSTLNFWEAFSAAKRLTVLSGRRNGTIPSVHPINEQVFDAVLDYMNSKLDDEE